MILYFSGTGNSRYIAQRMARTVGGEAVSLNGLLRDGGPVDLAAGEGLVFVTPTYAWRIPRAVEDWIRHRGPGDGRRAWFVMSCGDDIGGAEAHLRRLCADKGLIFMGAARIVMPENYIAMFSVPGPEKADGIVRRALPEIDGAAERVKKGEPFPGAKAGPFGWLKSGPVNAAFYALCVKAGPFRAGDGCVGCGVCEKVCPLKNIRLEGGRPVWGKNCTHCMACICTCPKEAIEYGRLTAGKRRYLFREPERKL